MPNFLLAIAFCGFVFSSAGDDTLPANGTLSNGQTLISRNRDFELGFFSPGSSKNRFLGIWYTKKPDVVVWVANRNDPVIDSQGVMMINLQVTRNGALVISRDGSIQWSSNSSRVAARNPSLRLLDTGNLVLADTAGEADSSEGSYIWQSFDYPSDTRLPGMYMVQSLDAGQDKYLTSWRSSDDPSPGDFTSIQFRDNCSCNAQLLRGKHDRRRRFWPFVEPHVKRCVQVGLLCVQKLAEDRPAMSSVVFMLGCEGEAAPEPNEPGFFMERSSNNVENQISSRKGSVTITMTELEGR